MINEYTREPVIDVSKSKFNLSYSVDTTCEIGELIPICAKQMVPGDKFTISADVFVRAMPLVAPILNKYRMRIDYFVDSHYAMDSKYFEAMSRIDISDTNSNIPVETDLVTFNDIGNTGTNGSYLDAMAFLSDGYVDRLYGSSVINNHSAGFITPYRLYSLNRIIDKYYQNADIQDNYVLGTDIRNPDYTITDVKKWDTPRYRNWTKDVFTSSKPWVQRFNSPVINFQAVGELKYNNLDTAYTNNSQLTVMTLNGDQVVAKANAVTGEGGTTYPTFSFSATNHTGENVERNVVATSQASNISGQYGYHNHSIDLAGIDVNVNTVEGVDMTTLRTSMLIQMFLEQQSRVGSRYDQYLLGMYGTAPSNEVLHEPVWIGGFDQAVTISEITQTSAGSSDTSPLGTLAGHGLSSRGGYIGEYYAKEFCTLIGVLSIYPEAVYSQGFERDCIHTGYFDIFNPMFVNFSNQPIFNCELFASDDDSDELLGVFGYEGIYDYMRFSHNRISGDLKNDNLSYWVSQRKFSSTPQLNEDFINIKPWVNQLKQPFAVQTADPFLVHVDNNISALRPIPTLAVPKFSIGGAL